MGTASIRVNADPLIRRDSLRVKLKQTQMKLRDCIKTDMSEIKGSFKK